MDNLRKFRNIIGKLICFTLFGIGSIFLGLWAHILNILYSDPQVCQRKKQKLVQNSFCLFKWLLHVFARCSVDTHLLQNSIKENSSPKGIIVIANHPTLIDIVLIISALPNADCIVNEKLFNNIWTKGIVSSLYISNGQAPEILLEKCKASLEMGNNLVIFPEGTRTNPQKPYPPDIKRGVAQISLRTQAALLPIHIHTENCVGLAKNDSLFDAHEGKYMRIKFFPKPMIYPENYAMDSLNRSAHKLTEDIKSAIFTHITGELKCH